jgi:hypothetical protein
MHDHIEVADFPAVSTGTTAPLQLDALTLVDAGRNANLDFARTLFDATAATGSAW